MTPPPRLAVVGGGISGLTAAWTLRRLAPQARITVFEGEARAGGAIETRREGELLLEGGPDSMITDRPQALELCRELGLEGEILPTRTQDRRALVVKGGRLLPLPEGFRLMAPTRLLPFMTSPVVSWLGKLRMGLDLVLPRRQGGQDETLASFVVRRLGREALDRLAQPLVAGIYGGDPERLSLQATMPRFLELERRHGSVIRGLVASMAAGEGTSGARYGLFVTLRGGMQRIIDRLVEALPPGALRAGMPVEGLRPLPGGRWALRIGEGEEEFEGVCLAMPAWAAARLAGGFDPGLGRALGRIRYSSSMAVNFVYRREQVSHPLDAFGFVVPRIEGLSLLACTCSSVKYEGRAPASRVILRAFAGGMGRDGPLLDPARREALVPILERELGQLMGVRGGPESVWVAPHLQAMPHYDLGHLDRVSALEAQVSAWPGLEVTGNGYRGVGLSDCVRGAREAAGRLAAGLSTGPAPGAKVEA